MKKFVVASLLLTGVFSLNSCARMGTPSGGERDTTPPKLIKANPDTLAVNVDPNIKQIEILFDEYVQIKEYNKNVVVSPPFERNPIVSPQILAEKFVKIKLQEPLQPNTTYNINFGDAIQDYNENNKLSNFSYVFSTGSFIDSLSIKGRVSSGFDFELPKKTLVGLYKITEDYNDSIILKSKPYYISRVNEKGEYDLKYLSEGKYKIVAFEDAVENSKFDLGKEKVAFRNEVIDLKENLNIDLKLFTQKPDYRLVKYEQKGYGHIVFRTEGAKQPLEVILNDREFKTAYVDQHLKNDSVNYWFNPKKEELKGKSERLSFEIKHGEQTDKANVLYSTPIKDYELSFKTVNETKLAPINDFKILASAPVQSVDKSLINVFKDSIAIPFDIKIDSINKQIVRFQFAKELGERFEINAYPNAFKDVFEMPNDTLVYQFKTGVREDFGNLKVRLNNLPEGSVFLQLLKKNQKYDVVDEKIGKGRLFDFTYLEPGEYYLRLLVDKNENGIWDSGNLMQQIQPEPVYIYPAKIIVRAMWDSDETWIIGSDSEFAFPIEVKKEEDQVKNKR